MKKDNFKSKLDKLESDLNKAIQKVDDINEEFQYLIEERVKLILNKAFKLNNTFKVHVIFWDTEPDINAVSVLKETDLHNDYIKFSCNQKLPKLFFSMTQDVCNSDYCIDLSHNMPTSLLLSDNWEEELERGINFVKQLTTDKKLKQTTDKKLKQQALNKLTSAERKALGL